MTSVDDKTGCRVGVNATYEIDEAHVKQKLEESFVQIISVHGIESLLNSNSIYNDFLLPTPLL